LSRTKFWKKEFVGRGLDSRFEEKNLEGSGRTVELGSIIGKTKGELILVVDSKSLFLVIVLVMNLLVL